MKMIPKKMLYLELLESFLILMQYFKIKSLNLLHITSMYEQLYV